MGNSNRILKSIKINSIVILLWISIVITIVMFVVNNINHNRFINNSEKLLTSYQIIQNTEKFLSQLKETEAKQRSYLLTGDDTFLEPFNQSNSQANETLEILIETAAEKRVHQRRLNKIASNLEGIINEMNSTIKKRQKNGIQQLLDEGLPNSAQISIENIKKQIRAIQEEEQTKAAQLQKDVEQSSLISTITMYIAGIFNVLIIFIAIFALRREKKSRVSLYNDLNQKNKKYVFDNGKVDEDVSEEVIVNYLISNLENAIDFVEQIGKGNYDIKFQGLDDSNIKNNKTNLAGALMNMKDLLKKASQEEQQRKQEDEKRNWATRGIAKFGDIMRKNNNDINDLSDRIITNLVYYLNINQGGLFILNDDEKTEPHLELIAAYAYDRKKYLNKKIEIGEGLVGACAIEKQTIYMNEVPDNYIEITSGVGGAAPRAILIVPLKLENHILGVVELASFKEFQKHEIEFVETIAENIASTLSTTRINAKTNKLLSDFRKQSEEMAAQEEEMRQNLEELQATQEEAARKSVELEGIIEAIGETLGAVEYDLNGKIINANDFILQKMNFLEEEFLGKHFLDFIPKDQIEKYKKIWNSIKNGETIVDERKIELEDTTLWGQQTYKPLKDEQGAIIKVLEIFIDITQRKIQENELRQQAENLRAKEKTLKQNMKELKMAQNKVTTQKEELEKANKKLATNQEILKKALEKSKAKEAEIQRQHELMKNQETIMKQNMEELSKMHEDMNIKHQQLETANKRLTNNEMILKQSIRKAEIKAKEYKRIINEKEKTIEELKKQA